MSFLELVDDDADELLILGDFEELLFSNMNILTTVTPYKHITQKVRDIASRKKVSYVVGNHDWNISLFASYIQPVKIASPFAREGVYYTHGHEYDWLSIITGTPVDPIYWKSPFPFLFPTQFLIWLATRVWAKSEDTYGLGIAAIHERARAYAQKNGYSSVVLGHTHFPADEIRGGIRLVNTGDMLDSYSYVVQEDGIIRLEYFR
jgi:UDP-2,3-diacylglucosamine pyrophosphatase LpxH